jgi:hypothetical protein
VRSFFCDSTAGSVLIGWLEQAKIVSEIMHAAYGHAHFANTQNLKYQLAKSGGTLDQQMKRLLI